MDYAKTLPLTKRSVLQLLAKIFDPLSFLALFTIVIKILFQLLCMDSANWDNAFVRIIDCLEQNNRGSFLLESCQGATMLLQGYQRQS